MKKSGIMLLLILAISSCAHHRDVRPGASGSHRIALRAADKSSSSREAIRQAQHFCEQRGQYAAITSENHRYIGDMDEATYNATKRLGNVARIVGGKSKNVGVGAAAADAATGDGYEVEMEFVCR